MPSGQEGENVNPEGGGERISPRNKGAQRPRGENLGGDGGAATCVKPGSRYEGAQRARCRRLHGKKRAPEVRQDAVRNARRPVAADAPSGRGPLLSLSGRGTNVPNVTISPVSTSSGRAMRCRGPLAVLALGGACHPAGEWEAVRNCRCIWAMMASISGRSCSSRSRVAASAAWARAAMSRRLCRSAASR